MTTLIQLRQTLEQMAACRVFVNFLKEHLISSLVLPNDELSYLPAKQGVWLCSGVLSSTHPLLSSVNCNVLYQVWNIYIEIIFQTHWTGNIIADIVELFRNKKTCIGSCCPILLELNSWSKKNFILHTKWATKKTYFPWYWLVSGGP